jgi:hypothetical protein
MLPIGRQAGKTAAGAVRTFWVLFGRSPSPRAYPIAPHRRQPTLERLPNPWTNRGSLAR